MARNNKLLGGVIAWGLLSVYLIARACQPTHSVGEMMENAVRAINAKCPTVIDENLRIDSATADSGFQMTCYYTLLRYGPAELDVAKFEASFRTYMINQFQSSEDFDDVRSMRVTFRYWVCDEYGERLADIKIRPEDYAD